MNTREFFIATIHEELPRFERVLKALPEDKLDYRPHEKSQSAKEVCNTMLMETLMIQQIVISGKVDFQLVMSQLKAGSHTETIEAFAANLNKLAADAGSITEEDWEKEAYMGDGKGMEWKSIRRMMSWQLFFDLIHHRGQLSTFLRPMGAKVPAIYGPSGDEKTGNGM